MFPSPFARRFGIKSASFANEQYRNQQRKAIQRRNCYQKVIICAGCPIFVYCGAIFALPGAFSLVTAVRFLNGRKSLFIDCGDSKHACPAPRRKIYTICAADLERRDYLSFLLKRPQGTTKFLGTPAFAGTKTPTALKSLAKGATTDCAETPVNCPHCGQK